MKRRSLLGLLPAGFAAALMSPGPGFAADAGTAPSSLLRTSEVLTGMPQLDPVLAGRIWAAFSAAAPQLMSSLHRVADLGANASDADALMQAAQAAGLGEAAAALVAAWYTGTIGEGTQARTAAYADALMYGTVADGLMPPTYVLGGPAWWTAPPPPAGVSKPVPKPALAAPVTGTPLPHTPGAPPSQRQPNGAAR